MELRSNWYKADKGKRFVLTEKGKKECANYRNKTVGEPVDEYDYETTKWSVDKGYVIETDIHGWTKGLKGYEVVYYHEGKYRLSAGNHVLKEKKMAYHLILLDARYFKKISGIGDSLVKSLDDYFGKHYEEMWELSQEFNFNVQHTEKNGTSLSGMSFVITGSLNKFKNRDALKEKIESLGGKVAGSVSSKTTVLINNDVESSSSKNKKAKSLNIPILSEDDFIEKYLGGDLN